MATTLTLVFKPDGSTELRVNGCKGPSCTDLTKSIRAVLGETTALMATSEMFEKPEQAHVVVGAGGE